MARLGEPRTDEEPGPSRGIEMPGFVRGAAGFLGEIGEEYARPLDEDEAERFRQDVIDMIVGYSADLDEFLTISNGAGDVSTIWRMDAEEAEPIANIWIKRAKRDKRAAAVLRFALQGDDYKRAALVLGPRLWGSATWYQTHGGWRMQPWEARKRS